MGFLGTSPFEESATEGGEKTSLKLERWGGCVVEAVGEVVSGHGGVT